MDELNELKSIKNSAFYSRVVAVICMLISILYILFGKTELAIIILVVGGFWATEARYWNTKEYIIKLNTEEEKND